MNMPMGGAYDRKPIPNRMPPPALNNDAYRSRSMVRPGEPTMYRPPPNSFQPGTAGAFRQQPYSTSPGPGQPPPASRTTAQGRHIPERVDDGRAMSMGHFSSMDRDHPQHLTSGRVVPARHRESESDPFADQFASPDSSGSFSSTNSPAYTPSTRSRRPSEGSNSASTPARTVSAASHVSTTSVSSDLTTTPVNGARSDSMRNRPTPTPSSSAGTTTTVAQRKSPWFIRPSSHGLPTFSKRELA